MATMFNSSGLGVGVGSKLEILVFCDLCSGKPITKHICLSGRVPKQNRAQNQGFALHRSGMLIIRVIDSSASARQEHGHDNLAYQKFNWSQNKLRSIKMIWIYNNLLKEQERWK